MTAPDWKARAEALQAGQQELVWLLLEACEHLKAQGGFKYGTGLDGAFLDRVSEAVSNSGIYDLGWLKRIRGFYGDERLKEIISRLRTRAAARGGR